MVPTMTFWKRQNMDTNKNQWLQQLERGVTL